MRSWLSIFNFQSGDVLYSLSEREFLYRSLGSGTFKKARPSSQQGDVKMHL
jgi:hypothetical protein